MKPFLQVLNDRENTEAITSSLFKNSPDPMLVIDPDNSIRYVNPAYVRQTGFNEDEIIGKKPPFPHWPAQYQRQYTRVFADFAIDEDEKQFCRKDGSLFWVKINASPVMENGGQNGIFAIGLILRTKKRLKPNPGNQKKNFPKPFIAVH